LGLFPQTAPENPPKTPPSPDARKGPFRQVVVSGADYPVRRPQIAVMEGSQIPRYLRIFVKKAHIAGFSVWGLSGADPAWSKKAYFANTGLNWAYFSGAGMQVREGGFRGGVLDTGVVCKRVEGCHHKLGTGASAAHCEGRRPCSSLRPARQTKTGLTKCVGPQSIDPFTW